MRHGFSRYLGTFALEAQGRSFLALLYMPTEKGS